MRRLKLLTTLLLLAAALLPAAVFAQGPQRIEFAPGATSANVRGVASSTTPVGYVLRAEAGQTLRVTANYVNNTYEVIVSAPGGAYLGKATTGRPWSGVLPASGDYGLIVTVPPMYTGSVYFNVDVAVTGGSGPAPTPGSTPGATPGSGPQRINFAAGATSATVTGQVAPGRPAVYVLRALAGQDMTVRGDGPGPFMTILTGADGSFLGSANANQPIQVRLPTTQDYFISLQAPADAPASNFSLTVSAVTPGMPTAVPTAIPTAVPTTSPQGPQRITFPPGGVSATVTGRVASGQPAIYVLRALAGQNMTVRADSAAAFTVLVTGADGVFLGSTPANTPLTVPLPTTQDYYITLQSTGATPANFALNVSVVTPGRPTPTPGRPTPTPVPARPQRINFAAGATAATVSGQVAPGAPTVYVLRALADQTMSVFAASTAPFRITITGADGSFLASGSANQTIETRLPATQDYYITLEAPIGGAPARYNLTVSVVGSTRPTPQPATQRIRFAPGATSATASGSAPQRYVLGAGAGQTMYVELSAAGPARFTVSGVDGRTLGGGTESIPWSGRLPATQDYYILIEGSGGVGFYLTVSIY